MFSPIIDRDVFTDLSWWHWAVTIPLLASQLAGYHWAIAVASGLCAAMGIYFLYRLRQIRPYPVQVRIAYLGMLVIGTLPWMQWIHWLQLCGTTAMVTVGYCPLIRMLSLIPPNRNEPLTASLIWFIFARQPCTGGLVNWRADSPCASSSCSLPTDRVTLACSLPRRESTAKEYCHAQDY